MSELLHNLFFAKKENVANATSRVSRTQHRLHLAQRGIRAPQASKGSHNCLTLQSTIFARTQLETCVPNFLQYFNLIYYLKITINYP